MAETFAQYFLVCTYMYHTSLRSVMSVGLTRPLRNHIQHWSDCTDDCIHLHFHGKTQTILVNHWFPRDSVIFYCRIIAQTFRCKKSLKPQAVFLIDKDSCSDSMHWMSSQVALTDKMHQKVLFVILCWVNLLIMFAFKYVQRLEQSSLRARYIEYFHETTSYILDVQHGVFFPVYPLGINAA